MTRSGGAEVQVLEKRTLLSGPGAEVTLSGGELIVADTSITGENDTLTLQSDTANSQFVIFDPNHDLSVTGVPGAVLSGDLHTVTVPFSSVAGGIRVDTQGGNDELAIDFSLGNFSLPIAYNGGTQTSAPGDRLTLVGGAFSTGAFAFNEAGDAAIDLAGNALISATGCEGTIATAATIDDISFSFGAGDEILALSDAGGTALTITGTVGESVTFANPGNSLTINAGAGNDTVNIASVNAAYNAALTINGDAGDDTVNLDAGIAFAAGRNLDVNLQNDTGTPGTDVIHVGAGAHLVLSGTGAATLAASGQITFAAGSSLGTVDGNLSIEANQQAVPSSAYAVGVDIDNASIRSIGAGTVMVRGRGGDDGGGVQYGVRIANGGTIGGGTIGLLTVEGNSGNGAGFLSYGVAVFDAGSMVTSSGADVSVTGVGGGTADFSINYGVLLQSGARITAGGSGAVSVGGLGSGTIGAFSSNYGVAVLDVGSRIDSSGGAVLVTGRGGGTDGGTGEFSSNYGISVQAGGQITAGVGGDVGVAGVGSQTAGSFSTNFGVHLTDADSRITSGGGDVSITGAGGGTGEWSSNYGIAVQAAAGISSGNGAAVTLIGTGGDLAALGSSNFGVYVTDAGSAITSGGGHVSVTGSGGGTGDLSSNYGVAVQAGGQISAGSVGAVTVNGIGSDGAAQASTNFGVYVTGGNSSISSSGGDVSVTGLGGGTGESSTNYGVAVQSSAQITAMGAGDVSVAGVGGNTSGPSSSNYGVYVTDSSVTSGGGDVSVSGAGGATGESSFNYGVLVQSSGEITAGGVGIVTVMGSGGATADAASTNYGVLVTDANATIDSSGGGVSVVGNAGGTGSSFNFGVAVQATGQITSGSNGAVSVVGTAGDSTDPASSNYGVHVTGLASLISSGGGDVVVTGIEGGGTSGIALVVEDSGAISTAAQGGAVSAIGNSIRFDSTATISASNDDSVTLGQYTDAVPIDLGTVTDTTGGPLGLSDAELDRVAAGTIIVGDSSSGSVLVSADIIHPAGADFEVRSGGDIVISGGQFNTGGGSLLLVPGLSSAAVRPIHAGVDVTAGRLTIAGNLAIVIDGSMVDSQFTQLNAAGEVDLAGTTLVLSGSYVPTAGESFLIVNNDGADAILGTFNGLPEHTVVTIHGVQKLATYVAGDGNDAALALLGAPPISLAAPDVVYNGSAYHAATASLTGIDGTQSSTLEGVGLVFTYYAGATATGSPIAPPINAGTYTVVVTFAGSASYLSSTSDPVTFQILKADPTIVLNPYHLTYDANAHTATGTATGVLSESLSGLVLTGTTHTHAGTYSTDPWTFVDTTGNYNDASGTIIDVIDKADPTIVVVPYNVLYDGLAHTATGTAKGVLNESLSGLVLTGTTHTTAGIYPTDPWTFVDTTGNYNNASGTVLDRIVMPASLSGYVYRDQGNDGSRVGDPGIPGVTVTLTGINDLGAAVTAVTTTNSSGLYQFSGLRPGTYALTETQPAGYLDGKDTIGTPGGITTNDKFSSIGLNEGVVGVENNFGEIGTAINGKKFLDVTGNGLTADDLPLAGASFKLFRDVNGNNTLDNGDGAALSATVSTTDGTFSFGNLLPGVYFVQEVAMAGYVRTGPTLTDYYTVNVQAGSQTDVLKFANAPVGCDCAISTSSIKYYINGSATPVTDLRGKVNSGDSVEVRFNVTQPGATFSLVSYTAPGASFDPNTAALQTIFDTDTITNASVGPHSLKVLVPNCYFQIDFICGLPIDHFGPAGSNIFYTQQGRLFSADNDGAQAYANSSLSGYVYRDNNNNGTKDSGEAGISNVTLLLSGNDILGNAVTAMVKTNNSGYYVFANLKASDLAGYRITETQPSGYNDGKDTIGSLGGTVANDRLTTYQLNSNKTGVNYNFGERPYMQLTVDAAVLEGEAPALVAGQTLMAGDILVAVEGLSGDQADAELARIADSITVLNAQLATFNVQFVLFCGASDDAQVHVRLADSSDIGGVAEGVLGVTSGNEITLVSGWDWYLGSRSTEIQAGQYDFQTVMTHEFGHVLGMGHSSDTSSVMYAALASGETRRMLSAADLLLIGEEETGSGPEALKAMPVPGPTLEIPQSILFNPQVQTPLNHQITVAFDPGVQPDSIERQTAAMSTPAAKAATFGDVDRGKGFAGRGTSLSKVLPAGLEAAPLDVFYSQLGSGRLHLSPSDQGLEVIEASCVEEYSDPSAIV